MDTTEEKDNKAVFYSSLFLTLAFTGLLWLIKIYEVFTGIELSHLGVYPGKISGLPGILTSPLVHSDFSHLISNSLTLIVLSFTLFFSYRKSAVPVFIIIYLATGLSVWLFARPAYHIGASGLIYGFLSYLFFVGLLRKDAKAIAISLLVTFLYGGLIWGVLPIDPDVSYESHLGGFIIGVVCAIIFRNTDPKEIKKYDWEDEEETEDEYTDDDFNPDEVEIKKDAEEVYFYNDDDDDDYDFQRKKRKK